MSPTWNVSATNYTDCEIDVNDFFDLENSFMDQYSPSASPPPVRPFWEEALDEDELENEREIYMPTYDSMQIYSKKQNLYDENEEL